MTTVFSEQPLALPGMLIVVVKIKMKMSLFDFSTEIARAETLHGFGTIVGRGSEIGAVAESFVVHLSIELCQLNFGTAAAALEFNTLTGRKMEGILSRYFKYCLSD